MITSLGVGSGLDLENIVSQLVALERRPLQVLQSRQQQVQARISNYGVIAAVASSLRTSATALGSPEKFDVFSATSADPDLFTATATASAAPGSYAIEVVRLAESHKMLSAEFSDSQTFGGGAGDSLTIQVGGEPADVVTVDLSAAKTLSQIRDAINNDSANPGVTARIVNGNDGKQVLSLTANLSGADNALTLSYGGAINAATFSLATINTEVVANGGNLDYLDASIEVDGYGVTRSTNTISDVIEGVTLNLKQTSAVGETALLTVSRNTAAISQAVEGFVTAYNNLQSSLTTVRANGLGGESTLLGLESRVRRVLNTPPSGITGSYAWLADIGISVDKEGVMSLDKVKLAEAMTEDFAGVVNLFADDDQGYAFRLEGLLDSYIDDEGIFDARTDGLNSELERIGQRAASLQRQLDLTETRIRNQFSALDTLIAELQTTSNFLTQQLDNLSNLGRNNR